MRKYDLSGTIKLYQWAIEGSDGSGKGTLTTNLVNVLRNEMGLRVGRVSFPRYEDTVGGRCLDLVLKSTKAASFKFSSLDPMAASLSYAQDRRESLPFLRDLIDNRDVVIYDRYVDSNLLHQGGKFKTDAERVKFVEWLYRLEYDDLELPRPRNTLYLMLPWEISLKRLKERAFATNDQLDAVEQDLVYMENSHNAGIFYAKHLNWEIIDCMDGDKERSPKSILNEARGIMGFLDPDYTASIP